jgi:hypothetical protein
MSDETGLGKHDHILMGLVFSLQHAAMVQLGKLQDPVSGELAPDLDQARATIDILDMLKTKCRAGTPEDLVRLLDQTVLNLQLNYMDELKKAAAGSSPGPDPTTAGDEAADTGSGAEA